ncbi:MAG: hypothetical protein AB2689_06070 [Candidatus Thiodiazotropha taylori]
MFKLVRDWLIKLLVKSTEDDHCEITPNEKATKVIHILSILDAQIRHAYEVKAYFCRAAYQNDVREYFDQTSAAPGYNQITISLYYDLIMTVVRMFDKLPNKIHAENTASLPELMLLLKDNNTVEVLKEHELTARTLPFDQVTAQEKIEPGFSSLHKRKVQESVDHMEAEITQLIKDFKTLSGSHYLRGLRNIRNELLAHTAININDKNVTRYGDAESLLKLTSDFIIRLNAVIRRLNDNYGKHVDRCTNSANDYWLMVITE